MTFGFSRDDAAKFLPYYYDNKILVSDPFATIDQIGVGRVVALAVEGDELTANVKVSAEANNALVAKEDGLHVDVSGKADKADTLAGYGIGDAYTKDEVDAIAEGKADVADTLAGYGITDAYTKAEVDALFTWKEIGNV
jgi:phage-related tail fiber protein